MRKLLYLLTGLILISTVFATSSCDINISATSTNDLLSQLTSINSELQDCSQTIPSEASSIVKEGNTFLNIERTNGSVESVTVSIDEENNVVSVKTGSLGECSQKVTISESDLDTALQSTSLSQSLSYLLGQNKLEISGCSFFSKMKFFFINPLLRYGARKATPNAPEPKDSN